MTLIPNLPAIVTVSGTDLLPINDVSENKTKRVTVNQLATIIAEIIGGGSGGGLIDLDSEGPIPITLGGFTAGEAGVYTANEYGNKLLRPYFAPVITFLTNAGLIKTFEVGESLPSGSQAVAYAISNPGQIKSQPPNIGVPSTNISGASFPVNPVLLSASSSFNIAIPSAFLLSAPGNRTITLTGTDSNDDPFSLTATIKWRYKVFYGPSSAAPSNSAAVRLLPSTQFDYKTSLGDTEDNTLILNTGTTQKIFSIAIPATRSLVSVFDLDALNAPLTTQYIAGLSTFNVNDANGNAVSYKIYTLTNGAAYASNHRHSFTIG